METSSADVKLNSLIFLYSTMDYTCRCIVNELLYYQFRNLHKYVMVTYIKTK